MHRLFSRRASVAALLGLLSLALHLTLERDFDRLGVFDQSNILFDADPDTRLAAISDGTHLGIKHPNLMPYFTPPITVIAKFLVTLSLGDGSEGNTRRALGTWVVPVASGLTTAMMFLLFCRLRFSLVQSTIATLLASLSFSTLIFGSIPESYGLTALTLGVAYVFTAGSGGDLSRSRVLASWLAIGVFATGITVINVVFVTLLMGVSVWDERRWVRATVRVATIAVAIFGLTGASAWLFDALLVRHQSTPIAAQETAVSRAIDPLRIEFTRYAAPDPRKQVLQFPTTLANTFAPSVLERKPIEPSQRHKSYRHKLGFTVRNAPSIFGFGDPLGASIFLLIIAGALCWLMNPPTRGIAVASIGIIAFSGLLSIWGLETYLYSQNWNLAAVVLMTGVMRAGPAARTMTVVLGVVTVAIGIRNLLLLRDLLETLAVAQP